MINILLLSHGKLAEEFLKTIELIMGEQKGIHALGLDDSESLESFMNRITTEYSILNNSDGILVLTDLYGGTPTNAAIYGLLSKYDSIEILTGINLSILLEAALRRDQPAIELINSLKKVGAEGIISVREVMKQ
ncbi:MAG: sugar transporter subunit [Clostridiales bacterium]|nr:sugar transporter subunit [Clostridiales bacterium]